MALRENEKTRHRLERADPWQEYARAHEFQLCSDFRIPTHVNSLDPQDFEKPARKSKKPPDFETTRQAAQICRIFGNPTLKSKTPPDFWKPNA